MDIHRILAATLAAAMFCTGATAGPVADAAKAGDADALRAALDAGGDPNEKGFAAPIYLASRTGDTASVALLLERGADPNAVGNLGTPLMIAARRKHAEVVGLLLGAGADPNLQGGEDNRAPLHEAAYMGAEDIVASLLSEGADPLARTRFGEPPIHEAAKKGRDGVVAMLREFRPEPADAPVTNDDLRGADLEAGRIAAIECSGCHAFEPDVAKGGPSLWDVVGRPLGGATGYLYSDAMKSAGGEWTIGELDSFLADPMMHVPGTNMDRAGIPDRATRVALIAWLRGLSNDPVPLE